MNKRQKKKRLAKFVWWKPTKGHAAPDFYIWKSGNIDTLNLTVWTEYPKPEDAIKFTIES